MDSDLERRVQQTGLWLYELIEGESPSVFRKEFWTGKMLEWCMQNEAFKVEMFRFVDVFPYLTRPESVARHVQEYFSRPGVNFPAVLQWGLRAVSPGSLTAKVIAKSITHNLHNMARQFIVGSNPSEALPNLERLRGQGMAFTIDLLGEAVVSEKEAEEYVSRYLELFDILDEAQRKWPAIGGGAQQADWGHAPKVNVSIKTSAMYSQMSARSFGDSVARSKEKLRPILRKALATGSFINLDMERHALKDLTLALFRSLMEEAEFRDYPHVGIVIQAYLKDSERDLEEILGWAKATGRHFTIRLVKGAYWDSEVIWARQSEWPVPVFTSKPETDASFEKLADIIMENHQWVSLACASHNMRSISYVMERARDLSVPAGRLEYQVLYGMGEPVRNALRKAGLPVRLYTPVGDMIQGMSYLVRRLLENTANESFLRKSFFQGVSRELLLRNPMDVPAEERTSPVPARDAPEYGDKGPFRNEPCFDWTIPEHRAGFRDALDRVRATFPIKVPLTIGGSRVDTSVRLRSKNPNRAEEMVGDVAGAGPLEADTAVEAAKAAFAAWRSTPPGERAEYLFKAATAARRIRYDLAALQVYEVGKAWSEADADVCEAIDFLEYYGREMIRLSRPKRMGHAPGEISHLFYEPRGVAAVIAPWNFPMAISIGMTSAALVTGNTVVYKPASQSPVVGSMVMNVFEEAGLPKSVLNFLPGPGAQIGDYLVHHPDVAVIAFTGSKKVGLDIIAQANRDAERAGHVKTVVAEMGGKNAIVVDADADLDEALVQIVHSAFGYQGQKCSACSRLIVLEEIYDKLVERLKAAAESIHLGPPEDPKNLMGAVIEAGARKRIMEYIELGRKDGTVLVERTVPGNEGFFVPLTILADLPPDHRLAREEIFGPVLVVFKVKDFARAIEIANDTEYALTGGVFSRSPANIDLARREFRTGNLYINRGCTGAVVERHPFGGFKLSGIGSKAGGPDYLLQFMVPRNVVENTLRRGFAPAEE